MLPLSLLSASALALDAPTVARELSPTFEADDLLSLPNFSVYLRLMIQGEPSKPFSASTASPDKRTSHLLKLF